MTTIEVKRLLLGLLPLGYIRWKDFSDDSDCDEILTAAAEQFALRICNNIDDADANNNPWTLIANGLQAWEIALVLQAGNLTTAQRKAAIISKIREHGAFTLANVRALIGPLLGYADPTLLTIVETPRSALTELHTYENLVGATIGASATVAQTVKVLDDALVGSSGALLAITINAANAENLSVVLTTPLSGAVLTYAAGCLGSGAVNGTRYLFGAEAAGVAIIGDWTMAIHNAGGAPETLTSWSLFVEGIGLDSQHLEGLGAEIFRWNVLADPTLVSAPDYTAALRKIQRIAPAHSEGKLAIEMSTGCSYAVCDDLYCIADQCICDMSWIKQTGSGSRHWIALASSADGVKLAAAENDGLIYTSVNSGVTWTPQAGSGSRPWYALASSSDGVKLVAALSAGVIYYSTDSGVTWGTQGGSSGDHVWMSVASSADGVNLIAAAYNDFIHISNNSGATWVPHASSQKWNWVASNSNGTRLAAVPENGYIYVSADSGVTWTSYGPSKTWSQIASSYEAGGADGDKLVAITLDGDVYTSVDYGLTWSLQADTVGSGTLVYIVSSANGDKLFSGTWNGYLYRSINSGFSWAKKMLASKLWRAITSSVDGNKLVAAVYAGYIYTGI